MSRGHIERLKSGTYRVVDYAGKDPITGRKTYVKETHPTETAAHVAAERLLAQVGSDRTPDRATLAHLLDRWMEVVDHELTTAETSAGYIRRTLKPALGEMPLRKLQHRVWFASATPPNTRTRRSSRADALSRRPATTSRG